MQTSTVIGVVATLIVVIIIGTVALFNALQSGHLGYIFRPHTVMMLDRSIEMVERYKSAWGQYPKTLGNTRTFLKEGETFPDLDFMGPLKFGERIRHLHYEPIGNGEAYYLFGVGLDDKPFSEDDVYPTNGAIEKSNGFRKLEVSA